MHVGAIFVYMIYRKRAVFFSFEVKGTVLPKPIFLLSAFSVHV